MNPVRTQLEAMYPPGYVAAPLVEIDIQGGNHPDTVPQEIEVHDARVLQDESGQTPAEFLATHGFVLLPHHSAVENWHSDEFTRIYHNEVEQMIREQLLPGVDAVVRQPGMVMRRGPGTENPYYGGIVHQDFALSPEDYEITASAFSDHELATFLRQHYTSPRFKGVIVLNFWRPTEMAEPVQHMPLAVLDPYTVSAEDVVHSSLLNLVPTPTRQLSLRYNPGQRWYYYPEMTCDEVLVFKNFQHFKSRPLKLHTCYHTAFALPDTPADAEQRRSSEHRVSVFCHDEAFVQ
ncbi:MAG: CmcJ/NvfI family oxidoreductase [Pseudomonadota bacterium]